MLGNCEVCGGLFNKLAGNVCPKCLEDLDEQYELVRKYLQKNPRAMLSEVTNATGVESGLIQKFLVDGRLQQTEMARAIKLQCKICGADILMGNVCKECAGKIVKEINDSDSEEVLKRGMHIRKGKNPESWQKE